MATRQIVSNPILPARVAKSRYAFQELFLIDVGASGGIDEFWNCLGPSLKGVGFDPLTAEVDRLNALRAHPGVRYEAAFVGAPDYDSLFPPALRQDPIASKDNSSFSQTSAARASEMMRANSVKDIYNAGAEVRFTDRHLSLDDYARQSAIPNVDFLKIDTDGHDIEVILGARKMLHERQVLGIYIESQLHGSTHLYSNTFANIDRLLREWGFTLFDFDLWRYSRGILPDKFVYRIAGQTLTGQVQWGEAVYFRDLARPDYERMHGLCAGVEKKVKLACLYELYGLPDCSAQILAQLRDQTGDPFFTKLLDELVIRYRGSRKTYSQFLEYFDSDPKRFYPER